MTSNSKNVLADIPTYTYDAFISYAHEDAETAKWLYNLLATFWVPGKKRRSIFMDSWSLGAGGLTQSLKNSLQSSKYLIVCCSKASAESEWVDLEIKEFLKHNPIENVLACVVGAKLDGPFNIPDAILAIEKQRQDSLLKPDLRGLFPALNRQAEKLATEAALSLLAPLIGLSSKDAILDRRKKQIIWATGIGVAVAILALVSFCTWQWWLTTPEGLKYTAVRKVLNAAKTETIDDLSLINTAKAFGKMNARSELEQVVDFLSDAKFKALALAAGYISLPEPDCQSAQQQLKKVDNTDARLWPEALLLTHRFCGGNWLAFAKPDLTNETNRDKWAEVLALTGHRAELRAFQKAHPLKNSFAQKVLLSISTKQPVPFNEQEFEQWVADKDAYSFLVDAIALLRQLNFAWMLSDDGSKKLLEVSLQAIGSVDLKQDNAWNLAQELTAYLAGAGYPEKAVKLLSIGAKTKLLQPVSPSWAPGWAWRGLAFKRLRRDTLSQACFEKAEECGNTVIPASRSYNEWHDVEMAYALAGDWQHAFAAAEFPADERTRILHRCKVIELWAGLNMSSQPK